MSVKVFVAIYKTETTCFVCHHMNRTFTDTNLSKPFDHFLNQIILLHISNGYNLTEKSLNQCTQCDN